MYSKYRSRAGDKSQQAIKINHNEIHGIQRDDYTTTSRRQEKEAFRKQRRMSVFLLIWYLVVVAAFGIFRAIPFSVFVANLIALMFLALIFL